MKVVDVMLVDPNTHICVVRRFDLPISTAGLDEAVEDLKTRAVARLVDIEAYKERNRAE